MEISGDGLVLEDKFFISFDLLESFPDSVELSKIDRENELILKASPILEENIEFEDNSVGQLLKRQDLKISLLLDMVSDILLAQKENLAELSIKLTCRGLECKSDRTSLKAGQNVKVSLYIAPSYPKALILFGQVFVDDNNNKTFVIFREDSLSSQVEESLEKLIFRHHRRLIAQEKRH